VEANYSVHKNPKYRALAGLSMGGRHTMYCGFNSLDLFGNFGVLSAGDNDAEKTLSSFLNDPKVNDKITYLFIGQGDQEEQGFLMPACRACAKRSIITTLNTTTMLVAAWVTTGQPGGTCFITGFYPTCGENKNCLHTQKDDLPILRN